MPDFRSFAPDAEADAREIVLSPEESHHLVRVNRARKGAEVVAFDGKGWEWSTTLLADDRREARLAVKHHRSIPPLPFQISLAQALPKGKTLDLIIRKATELGVTRILPLVSDHAEVRMDEARQGAKHGKWETAAIEAAKQSGNSYLPEIAPIQSVPEFLSGAADYDLKLIGSLRPGAAPLHSALDRFIRDQGRAPRSAVWLIGPEGDFSPSESEAAEAAGFAPVTLGRLVLRCETAAIYALSILTYELQRA